MRVLDQIRGQETEPHELGGIHRLKIDADAEALLNGVEQLEDAQRVEKARLK